MQQHIGHRELEERKPVNRVTQVPTTTSSTNDQTPSDSRAISPEADDNDERPPVHDLQWAIEIFDGMGEDRRKLMFTEFSNKSRIVLSIAKAAVKLKENVLIFVHSIPTLEYLEEKLKHKGYRVFVLTGATPMKDRQREIAKFNRERGSIYLISCRVSTLTSLH